MGSAPSKQVEAGAQEKLAEALRAMELKNERDLVEKDYVYVRDDPPPRYAPCEHQSTVSVSTTEKWEKELLEDPKNKLALNALQSNNANAILANTSAAVRDTQVFNLAIPFEGAPVTNQRSSGRCWLFASTNVFRVAIMKKYKLEKFELSQQYLFYWDKIEKANYFLENVLETVDDPLDGRLLQALLASPVGDGGQWDMVANLVQKYGLVSLYNFTAPSLV